MDNKTLMRIAKALERLIKLVEDDIKGVHRKNKTWLILLFMEL